MGDVGDRYRHAVLRHGSISRWAHEPFVARVTRCPTRPTPFRAQEVLVTSESVADGDAIQGFLAVLEIGETKSADAQTGAPVVGLLCPQLGYIEEGDVVRINPIRGEVSVLFRRRSEHNSIFITGRCSNCCLMCSQPPVDAVDNYRCTEWFAAIPLLPRNTTELGITGGEPTLLGDSFVELVRRLKSWLPETRLHVLSNGRLFRYMTFAQALASVRHPALTIAVPLFADLPDLHDYIVQRHGAFDETIRGLLNLARFKMAVEVRVVIQKANACRLQEMSRFVAVNLPFVTQVSLMALEPTGFAKSNADAVWIDPAEYGKELERAVMTLEAAHLNPVIMNHQLCVLDRALWPFAVKSISDYKNVLLEECSGCSVTHQCAGLFASARTCHSAHIAPVVSGTTPSTQSV